MYRRVSSVSLMALALACAASCKNSGSDSKQPQEKPAEPSSPSPAVQCQRALETTWKALDSERMALVPLGKGFERDVESYIQDGTKTFIPLCSALPEEARACMAENGVASECSVSIGNRAQLLGSLPSLYTGVSSHLSQAPGGSPRSTTALSESEVAARLKYLKGTWEGSGTANAGELWTFGDTSLQIENEADGAFGHGNFAVAHHQWNQFSLEQGDRGYSIIYLPSGPSVIYAFNSGTLPHHQPVASLEEFQIQLDLPTGALAASVTGSGGQQLPVLAESKETYLLQRSKDGCRAIDMRGLSTDASCTISKNDSDETILSVAFTPSTHNEATSLELPIADGNVFISPEFRDHGRRVRRR